jgi:hypothetical protein
MKEIFGEKFRNLQQNRNVENVQKLFGGEINE